MTDWTNLVYYECKFSRCQENCINHVDSRAAYEGCCRTCLASPPEPVGVIAAQD